MAWTVKNSDATQLTSITTEQFFDKLVTLKPREIAHVQLEGNPVPSPTDDLIFSIYTTLDDATEAWDLVPLQVVPLAKELDPNRISIIVGPGIYKFRIGAKRSGTTDTITSADMFYRLDGVSV